MIVAKSIKIRNEAHLLLRFLRTMDINIQDWLSELVVREFAEKYPELVSLARKNASEEERKDLDKLLIGRLTEDCVFKGTRDTGIEILR